jgi:replicative DNA helicase
VTAARRRLRPRHEAPELVDPPSVAGRPPPHDLDAEAAVLSAILLDRDALDRVLEVLKPEHFYSEANARIFQAAQRLAADLMPIDMVSVASWLRDREWLQKVGGTAYLARIADATPAVGHVGAHAKVVHEKWRKREAITLCQRTTAELYGDCGDFQAFIVGHAEQVDTIAQGGETRRQLVSASDVLQDVFKTIRDAAERGVRITGISTGYERLDARTAGLHEGDLTIVAARPGMGKTSFVLNIAVNVASPRVVTVPPRDGVGPSTEHSERGDGVCVFSLEMPREQLATRMVCSEGRVDLGLVRQGLLQNSDWKKLTEAASFLSTLPIWIDDTPAINLAVLRSKIRRKQAEYNRDATDTQPARRVGLVMVDYLQLMKGREDVNSREQEISEISRGLKALAKELGLPIIALSQLNRAVETRGKDKHPQLSDLRESGAIEQDADNIIFITRPDYYDPQTDQKGIADLDIAKQRNGPTGRIKLRFSASCTRFDNLDPGDYPESDDE